MSVANSTKLQGAKIAVIVEASVLTYLRDDFDHIPNPNQWDLPGGVREDGETALSCALRETKEEFGIDLPRASIVHEATYIAEAAGNLPRREVAFFACFGPAGLTDMITFGTEGQRWEMMAIDAFLSRKDAVHEVQSAFKAFWHD